MTQLPGPSAQPQPGDIFKALADVMADVGPVAKADWNDFHHYRFRGIDRVLDEVGPALREHRVLPVPWLQEIESRYSTTAQSKEQREVTLKVGYRFVAASDGSEILVGPVPGEAADTTDKAVAKAMSVAYRTCLIQLFAIVTGENIDHDTEDLERTGRSPYQVAVETVQQLAADRGWDLSGLEHDFRVFMGDDADDVKAADLETLTRYIENLDPSPKTETVKRKPRKGTQPKPELPDPARKP